MTIDLSRSVSEIYGDICKIFQPLAVSAPAEGFPWNFVTTVGLEKNWNGVLTEHQKIVTVCAFILTEYRHWTDRRTDRRTELAKHYRALHALHADARQNDCGATEIETTGRTRHGPRKTGSFYYAA